jgi:hypothetical protein
MRLLTQLFGLALVAVIGYALYTAAIHSDDGPKSFFVGPDSTVTFTGKVLANVSSCFQTNSSKCFLQIKSGETEVFVFYNTDDNSFCKNEQTATDGRNIKVGSSVKVYGFYRMEDKRNSVFTCPSTKYYIQPF